VRFLDRRGCSYHKRAASVCVTNGAGAPEIVNRAITNPGFPLLVAHLSMINKNSEFVVAELISNEKV